MKIRCSELDRLFNCPASVLGPEISVDQKNAAADFGKHVHDSLAQIVDGNSPMLHQFEDASDNDRGWKMLDYAHKIWADDLSKYYPSPQVEAMVDSQISTSLRDTLTGTIDVLSQISTDKANILDWKTGEIQKGFDNQMAGYAFLIWVKMGRPANARISVTIVYLRHHHWRTIKFDAAKLRAWEHDLIHNALGAGPSKYVTGGHCTFCPKRHSCKARQAEVSGTIDALMWGNQAQSVEHKEFFDKAKAALTNGNAITPELVEMLKIMLYRVRLAKRAADECWDLARKTVDKFGEIRLDDETVAALVPSERFKITDSVGLFPFLVDRFGSEEEALKTVDINVSRMKGAQRGCAKAKSLSPAAAVSGLFDTIVKNKWGKLTTVNTLRELAIPIEKEAAYVIDTEDSGSGDGTPVTFPGSGERGNEREVDGS
jgi:hypothetical protein